MHAKYKRQGPGRPRVLIHTGIHANILDLDRVWVTPVDMFVETRGDGYLKFVHFIVCELYQQEKMGIHAYIKTSCERGSVYTKA